MNKLVSIIIPTYGRPDTLSNAIDSCLAQTYDLIEIIVVDDNDPCTPAREATEQVMDSYMSEPKVRYIKHERNKNGSAARNTGFNNSKGDYIVFLDDDDCFYPTKVESQVNLLSRLPDEYGVCYSKYETRKNGKVILSYQDNLEGDLLEYALMRNLFIAAGSNLMVRRHVVDEINGFDESFKRNQDLEFLVRILQRYKIAYDKNLGLVVNAATAPKNIDFLSVTRQFRDNFNVFISKLPPQKIKCIDKIISLQIFRYYLLSKKNPKAAINHLKHNDISIFTAISYLTYLLKRAVLKSSESYHIY